VWSGGGGGPVWRARARAGGSPQWDTEQRGGKGGAGVAVPYTPRARTTVTPRRSNCSIKLSGTAEPPQGTARKLDRSYGCCSSRASRPMRTVGTPADTVTARIWMSWAISLGGGHGQG